MRKFETGKRYGENTVVFEIVKFMNGTEEKYFSQAVKQ